jgi:cell wall-associated NlpC family hydrolase
VPFVTVTTASLSYVARAARRAGSVALLTTCLVAVAQAQEPVRPLQEMSASASSMRDSVVALARAQLGTPYVRGGQSPEKGFDCSGLVKYLMAAFRLDVPRTARQQARVGQPLERDTSRLRPGDLLTFGRAKEGIDHIGIYVGGGRFIHASSVAGRVVESRVNRPPSRLIKAWRGARRLLALDDSSVTTPALPSTSGATGATGTATQSTSDRSRG